MTQVQEAMGVEATAPVLSFRPFDCDNHYYEAEDAFTRYLDPSHGRRVIEWCQIGKRRYHVIGGR